MTDPNNAATQVINMGAIVLAGSVSGMPLEDVVFGAWGGSCTVGLQPPARRMAGFSMVAVSAVLAGGGAHHVAWAVENWLGLPSSPHVLCAFVIGAGWPEFVRLVWPMVEAMRDPIVAFFKRRWGG